MLQPPLIMLARNRALGVGLQREPVAPWDTLAWSAATAAAAPLLLTYTPGPQTAFFKDALGLACWGAFFVLAGHRLAAGPRTEVGRGAHALLAAIATMALAAAGSVLLTGALPGVAASDVFGLAAAAAAMLVGNRLGRLASLSQRASARPHGEVAIVGFWSGLAAAALLNAVVAAAQVYAPAAMATMGFGMAGAPLSGRGIGLVRQSNVLATLMVWGAAALVALAERGRVRSSFLLIGGAVLMFGAVVSGSRTGVACVALLGFWALTDRRLTRPVRIGLAALPGLYLVSWAVGLWLTTRLVDIGALAKDAGVVRSDLGSPRWALWRQSLNLIADQPWFGVGWGNFNFAWTLTPMERPTAHHFTHAHNALLHWAVELGVPLTLVLLGLVAFAARRAVGGMAQRPIEAHADRSAALLVVAVAAVHSLSEFPLWYAHLLLPVAFSFGLALAAECTTAVNPAACPERIGFVGGLASRVVPRAPRPAHGELPWANGTPPRLAIWGWAFVAGAVLGIWAHMPTLELMHPSDPMAPIEDRVDAASRSWLYPEWGQRFRATLASSGNRSLEPFDRGAARRLLDERLLLAWALTYHELGDDDRAWYLAQRMGEFRTPAARRLFAHCGESSVAVPGGAIDPALPIAELELPAGSGRAMEGSAVAPASIDETRDRGSARVVPTFQCGARAVDLTWRDFVRSGDAANR
ncbi:MAG: O-antigen ligase family protein [Rubrivivax sp.]|nr:O-antigen ligase family protein [Rubrivivax sp.]